MESHLPPGAHGETMNHAGTAKGKHLQFDQNCGADVSIPTRSSSCVFSPLYPPFVAERGEFTKRRRGEEKNKSSRAATIHVFSL